MTVCRDARERNNKRIYGARHRPGGRISALCLLILASLLTAAGMAGESAGHGQVSIDYQYIHIDGFRSSVGTGNIGTTDTHAVNLEVHYSLNDKWSISAGIPLITKRYRGGVPHDPAAISPAPDAEFIDDGDYHTEFQDWHFGVRYLAHSGRLSIEPFAALGVPSHDYPFFAHAAVGQNLWKLEIGASFTYLPPLSDFYIRLDPGYVFVEETLGVNIDHWRIHTELGYYLRQNLTVRGFAIIKEGNGLDFPEDFPPPRNDEFWYNHDRMVRHNFINAGIGLDWAINRDYVVSFSAMKMVHAEQVHKMDRAFTLGVTRGF